MKQKNAPRNTLKAWLRMGDGMSYHEKNHLGRTDRERLADLAGTSLGYLYQIAGGHRRCSADLAIRLEVASRKLRAKNGRLPTLRRQALAPHINWRQMAQR